MPLSPPALPGAAPSNRRWELDALRGLMLVLMTLTHLPTRFSDPFGQPFGFVSAAEGFVMLSAYMAGRVYTGKALKKGEAAMQQAFLQRAWKIYACQALLLLFLFTIIAVLGLQARQDAVTNLISYYLDHPLSAFFGGLLLVYSPPLLDILPMYILLMLASPVLLLHGWHHGWGWVLAGSVALWLAAQFGASRALYDAAASLTQGKLIPYEQLGSFHLLAWQFLWVLGLWMGSNSAREPQAAALDWPRWMLRAAIGVAVVGVLWRHAVGQAPFPGGGPNAEGLNLMFDKWQLGPLRLINFLALLVLVLHFGPWLKRHLPRVPALETLGAASLPVFCAHLMLALAALGVFGAAEPGRPVWIDLTILGATFCALYAVAWGSLRIDERAAALLRARAGRRARRGVSGTPSAAPPPARPGAGPQGPEPAPAAAGEALSPPSKAHSPGR